MTKRFYRSQKERLLRVIPIAILMSIGLGFLLYFLNRYLFLRFEFSLVFVAIGYAMALGVVKFGKGVGLPFQIVALVGYILAIYIGECLMPALVSQMSIITVTQIYLSSFLDISGLVSLLFRIIGGLIAFANTQ